MRSTRLHRTAPAAAPAASLRDLPAETFRAAVAAFRSWPARDLGEQPSRGLLDRLLDRPLHAPPFAGAAMLGDAWLLLADGLVLGAVDSGTGEVGDGVLEALPERTPAVLYPAPEGLGAGCVRGLASLLHPPRLRHEGLDSSYVNLAALAGKLLRGGVRRRPPAAAQRRSGDGGLRPGAPCSRSSPRGGTGCRSSAPGTSGSRGWRCGPTSRSGARSPLPLVPARAAQRRARRSRGVPPAAGLLAEDPVYRFLRWSLADLATFFRERDRDGEMEVPDRLAGRRAPGEAPSRPAARRARPHRLLRSRHLRRGRPRLHLARRVSRGTPEAFARFRDDVIQAKTARLKTGDIGGAFLIARRFDPQTVEAWRAERASTTGRWSFGVEESFTGYEGFVRVGPRRGFHLLLVEETEGGFVPVSSYSPRSISTKSSCARARFPRWRSRISSRKRWPTPTGRTSQ